MLDSGGLRGLEHLLQAREAPRQEAAVEALAALTVGNAAVPDNIVASRKFSMLVPEVLAELPGHPLLDMMGPA